MANQVTNKLKGYLRIKILGYSPERFLNLCKHRNIEIWGLEAKKDAYEMYITVKDFRELKPILRKTRTCIIILERYGVPFFFHKYRKRKVFFMGALLCVFIIFFLSRFIWKIDIRGNLSITDQVILEYLESEKVYHGMKIRAVKCEEIATNIRKQFNDITWVSASLEGCKLIISVQENTDTIQANQETKAASDIVSDVDGYITEIVTRNGVPNVKSGDEVKKGDILVSGTVPVMNDAGEVVREDYRTADADIIAEVVIPYDDFCETNYEKKEYLKKKRSQLLFDCFGYHFALGPGDYKNQKQETSSKTVQLKINESFYLPISYGTMQRKAYKLVKSSRSEEEMKHILNHNLERYCKDLEKSGAVILKKDIQISKGTDGVYAKGTIKVQQSIGKSVDLSPPPMVE